MGYSTYFTGAFQLSRKLTVSERETFNAITGTGDLAEHLDDLHEEHQELVPRTDCPWMVSEDGDELTTIDEEKMYEHEEWLQYIFDNVLTDAGVQANGRMTWHGEDIGDSGVFFVKDNEVRTRCIDEMPEPNWSEPDPDMDGPSPGASPLSLLQGKA